MPNATTDRARLIRYLTEDLPPADRAEVEARLARDDAFRTRLERLRATHRFVQTNATTAFDAGFAGRVMDRVRAERADEAPLYDALHGLFLRVALACVLLIVALGSYNAVQYADASRTVSVVEAALGLPDASVQTALESEPILDDGT